MLVDDAFVRDRYQHDVHSPEPYALDMDDARSLPGIAACGDGDGGQSRNAPSPSNHPIHGGRAAGRALPVLGACGRGPVAFHFGLHTGYLIFSMAEY